MRNEFTAIVERALILDDRREDGLRGVPASAKREKVVINFSIPETA